MQESDDSAERLDPHDEANKVISDGSGPRPKYETPQEELEEVPTTDPGAAHIDPEATAYKPV